MAVDSWRTFPAPMLLCSFTTAGPTSGAIENTRRAGGRPAPNREAKWLVRNPWGNSPLAIRHCSPSRLNCAGIAPDRKRPNTPDAFVPAALRTADGQSMTKGPRHRHGVCCCQIPACARRQTNGGMKGRVAAGGAHGDGCGKRGHCHGHGRGSVGPRGQSRGQVARSRALPAVEPSGTGRSRGGTGSPVMAGNGRKTGRADQRPVRLARDHAPRPCRASR